MLKVSVIVPVYNSQKFLARCLDSLLAQTLKDIEIICINDGSDDESLLILEKYSKIDTRIRLYSQENKGQGSARNKGIEYSKGEFISFVDSDDFIDSTYLEVLYNCAKKNNCEIAVASLVRENEKKKNVLINYDKMQVVHCAFDKFKMAYLPKYCFVCNKLFQRKALLESKILFLEDFLYEDMIFTPKALLKLGKMVCCREVFYHYWKNNKSTIKQQNDKARADKLEANKFLMKICSEVGLKKSKNELVSKKEYHFLGIKLLKVYNYRATKRYYLFGFLPFLISKENI